MDRAGSHTFRENNLAQLPDGHRIDRFRFAGGRDRVRSRYEFGAVDFGGEREHFENFTDRQMVRRRTVSELFERGYNFRVYNKEKEVLY